MDPKQFCSDPDLANQTYLDPDMAPIPNCIPSNPEPNTFGSVSSINFSNILKTYPNKFCIQIENIIIQTEVLFKTNFKVSTHLK